MPEPTDQLDGAYSNGAPRPPRRRLSVWTVLAPVGALALFVIFFAALSNSCLSDGCSSKDEKEDTNKPANDLKAGAKAKVRAGDSMGSIASRYNLKLDDLKACNPKIDPVAIQPGQLMKVSAIDCEDADLAAVGANPDPLEGETSAGANGAKGASPNGTAAADPSAGGNPAAGAKANDNPAAENAAAAETKTGAAANAGTDDDQ